MSYLNTPRICILGTFQAAGPTRNNLLAALDFPAIFDQGPGWDFNPAANGDFTLVDCRVVAAFDSHGHLIVDRCADPVIGACVSGTGKMADLDPEQRRVTDLVAMQFSIALPETGDNEPPASVSGKLETTQLRDYWQSAAGVVVTAWQSVICEPLWSQGIERSNVLKQLRDASPDRLSVRLTPITNAALTGTLFAVVGPAGAQEPRQFVAARRLVTIRPLGQLPFPVASCLVVAGRMKIVVDLSNMPAVPYKPAADLLITGLTAYILQTPDEGGGVWTTLGPSRDLTTGQWLQSAGIVEWDLNPAQIVLLQNHRLRLMFRLESDSLVMEEHPTALYIDVDRRSMRLELGDEKRIDVYARQFGQPVDGQVVNFYLEQQKAVAAVETIVHPGDFGYPTDVNRLMNSEPREVLFDKPGPLRVVTDADGHGQLKIKVHGSSINLPASRKTIDSQLYFLGEPHGWQTFGAIGPNNGDLSSTPVGAGCALSVLVHNTHPAIEDPCWETIEPWMKRYALLYPAMIGQPTVNLDLSDKDQVERDAFEIYRRLQCIDFDDVRYMPVTRDLSSFRRNTILAYLRSVISGPPPC